MSNTAKQKKVGRQVAFSGAAPTLAPRAQRSAVLGSAGRKLVLGTANITAVLCFSCTVVLNCRQQAKFIAGYLLAPVCSTIPGRHGSAY
jgi:hypothetical protein